MRQQNAMCTRNRFFFFFFDCEGYSKIDAICKKKRKVRMSVAVFSVRVDSTCQTSSGGLCASLFYDSATLSFVVAPPIATSARQLTVDTCSVHRSASLTGAVSAGHDVVNEVVGDEDDDGLVFNHV
jgi:hypothetical protein